jgi:o-succinylbenzoate synthase
MAYSASVVKKVFQFNFKARTSRGLMKDKISWFIKILDSENSSVVGIGECGPLPGLSVDSRPDYEDVLNQVVGKVSGLTSVHPENVYSSLSEIVPPGFPSIRMGLETAMLDLLNGGKRLIFNNSFITGQPIPINGLIWMGDMDFMMNQINQKIAEGFDCIKLKVGGLDFDRECDTLNYLRKRYFKNNIVIRLDANGAFKPEDVLYRIEQLAKFNIQSIEQPIKAGQEEMEELCRKSIIPVAFDEELIGKETAEEKRGLLERLKPQFIILKPSLHGGFSGCAEWISIAESLSIGWWITSALESSIGLNAICQFTANYDIKLHQGLGTGSIYSNNFPSPLQVSKGNISYSSVGEWDISGLQQ